MKLPAIAIALAATTLFGSGANAQEPTPGEKLFLEGRQLLDQGKVDEACAKFVESYELERALGSLLNLANCEERRNKLRAALLRWREAAARADTDKNRLYALGRAADLEGKMPKVMLRVGASATKATVTIDGESVAINERVALDPGKHVIEATLAGDAPKVERRELELSGTGVVDVELFAAGPIAPPGSASSTDWALPGWISLGIGGAGAVVFAATGIVTLQRCDAELAGESHVCVDDAGNPTEAPTGLLVGNLIGAVVGIAGVGLGVSFLVVEATDDDAPAVGVALFPTPGGAVAVIGGRF